MKWSRLALVEWCLAAFAVAVVLRAALLQLVQHSTWERLAQRQQFAASALPAPRGAIVDMEGVPLAESQVLVRLAVVPNEVRDRRRLQAVLRRLNVDRETIARAVDPRRRWVPIPGTFLASDVAALRALPGVRLEPAAQRVYAPSAGLRQIVGRMGSEGGALDGLELLLDSLLRGERGGVRPAVGARGERYEVPEAMKQLPRPGHTVQLTISYTVQQICDRALADAVERSDGSGGDVLVLEPKSGEIRCSVSLRSGGAPSSSMTIVEPFEPGSTLKPFVAGALLELGRATLDEVVDVYGGVYRVEGRTITDVHKAERLSLADVIRYSSNVGIVRFAERLSARELYETLRDYGFGTATGVTYPAEASGTLRHPRYWSRQSHASLAIGYEVAVTPLQLALAYAAIANDGWLVQPALVREIRDADDRVVYRHRPQRVRRVLRAETAAQLRKLLAAVVDSGTASDAALATFTFGGKTGTSRRAQGGRYGAGRYFSLFVGLFPATEPQYVVLVKVDDPQGVYYGGKAAAPVARAVVEAALAARDVPLERARLAAEKVLRAPRNTRSQEQQVTAQSANVPRDSEGMDASPTVPTDRVWHFSLRDGLPRPAEGGIEAVIVPDVRGLPLRRAVLELHRLGLRVAVSHGGGEWHLEPGPGSVVRQGSLVRVSVP
ncbi:MAG TPA: penicillin-binding transpeptidase domain-containing protein [Gemmatimonadaceae bacterium]|nr:penicillin-binding transpeptidase domain-containing protein [Gemmatimonadaceae bacterium]